MRLVTTTIALLSVLLAQACGRPLLDGGWVGQAACGAETYPLTAVMNETQDFEVEGIVYVENVNVLVARIIVRETIQNGEIDPDDLSISFDLAGSDNSQPIFDVDLEFSNDEFTELEGTAEQKDSGGNVTNTCVVDFEKITVVD